jgi:hypothetical protein
MHDGAGVKQSLYRGSRVVGTKVLIDQRAESGDLAPDRMKILNRERDAFERSRFGFHIACLGSFGML